MIRLVEVLTGIWVGVTLFALMAVVLVDVILRNILNAPLSAGTEITEVLMGALGFGALPLLALNLSHISVDLLPVRYGSLFHRLIGVVTSLLTTGLFWLLTVRMYAMVARSARTGEVLPQLGLSWSWIWMLLCGLSALTVLASLVAALRSAVGAHVPQPGAEA